jgi:hypothetical protein
MYSRYHDASNRPIRLPENYNGCAFSPRQEEKRATVAPEIPRRMEIAKPSPLPPPERERVSAPPFEEPPAVQQTGVLLPSSPLPGLFGGHSRIDSWLHGIGFEELLLLGLILLLAGSEESSDVVLWLVLLLFCG